MPRSIQALRSRKCDCCFAYRNLQPALVGLAYKNRVAYSASSWPAASCSHDHDWSYLYDSYGCDDEAGQ